ncbi:putative DD41D transposase [Trichonephila clavipes]|nr:putative DD41D transposase [Trichonephila clavipes]
MCDVPFLRNYCSQRLVTASAGLSIGRQGPGGIQKSPDTLDLTKFSGYKFRSSSAKRARSSSVPNARKELKTAWNWRGRKYSPAPCTHGFCSNKTFRLPDLMSTYSVFTQRVNLVASNPGPPVWSIEVQVGDRFNSCQVIYSQFGLAIHQNDHQARRGFVEWAQNEIAVVPYFRKRILFSDEAHFWLNGYVNKQNCRIWSGANSQVYVETPLHPEKLTVWCALWAGGILLQKR